MHKHHHSRLLPKTFGLSFAATAFAGVLMTTDQAFAQGCIAARGAGVSTAGQYGLHLGEAMPPESGFQASVSYRWLNSDRHFTGDHEDVERQEQGSQVINNSHFIDLGVSYAFNPRFSVSMALPFVVHDRSQTYVLNGDRERFHTQSSGIGDVRFEGNMWILDPKEHMKGNVLVGAGFAAPTGEKDATDMFARVVNNQLTAREQTVDQSIQPGTGGWGILLDLYAYQEIVPRLNAYLNGAYTITPEEKNGVPTFRSNPFEAEMSITDNYMGRGGLEYTLWPKYGLSLSFGGRIEGVPVYDLVGGSDGFRRPGYAISVEPGVAVNINSWSFGLTTPVAVYRNREQSVPDKQQSSATGREVHGDAAFADFTVLFTIAKRF